MSSRTTARGRYLLVVAMLGSLFALAVPTRAQADPAPGFVDAGDLSPALFPFLDAVLHVRDAPGPGVLRSITTDGSGMTFHFAGFVLFLSAGQPDAATASPLVASLLERQITVPLLPDSDITYRLLATAAPQASRDGIPALLDAGGSLSPLPSDALSAARAMPEARIIDGYHVPLPFAPLVASDSSTPPISPAPDAIARQATELARTGMPLREPVWIAATGGYRLVQPFTRRVLVWDPAANVVSATDAGDAATAAQLIPDGGIGGALLADLVLRLMQVEDGIGVAITYTTPRGTLAVSLHGAERYPAASVMKLAILAAVEDGIARGILQRDADVDDLEEQMIVDSDNDAANQLIDLVGRAQINVVMQHLGMTQSYIGSHFDVAYGDDDDDNYLTPRESLRLMDALLSGEVGDPARIRDLLGRSQAPGSVRDALPDTGAALYEKRGWYDGVENDVVRLDLSHGATIMIAIFEPDVADIDAAWALFADLAHLAVDVASSP
ncbi:MAG: serine hydrolase [Thermomicrobiales bacterium]